MVHKTTGLKMGGSPSESEIKEEVDLPFDVA